MLPARGLPVLPFLLAACASGGGEPRASGPVPADPLPEPSPPAFLEEGEEEDSEPILKDAELELEDGAWAGAEAGLEGDPAGEARPALDGRTLYLHNCSGCHGETGKGDGETTRQLGVQARSFAEGRFSFGNAPEDIFRTLSSGIPGRSVMPGFKGTLSEEERWAIVAHVRTLMPAAETTAGKASLLEVGDRAIVARGKLPPIGEGAPERPQGLLVGTPEGLTFEWTIDDVRLLGVRQGRFADRTDWNDRGGGYLRPLGQPIYRFHGGAPDATFALWAARGEARPLAARLIATEVDGARGIVEYALFDGGRIVAEARERLSAEGLTSGAAFTRQVQITPRESSLRIAMLVAGGGEAPFPDQAGFGGAPDAREGWLVSEAREGVHEAVHVRLSRVALVGAGAQGVYVAFDTDQPIVLAVTVALTADVSQGMLETLAGEIGR